MAAKVAKINEQIKKGLHEPFDYQIEDYNNWIELIKHNQNLEVAAKELSRSLPSKEALDKILRYETAIERNSIEPCTDWSDCNVGDKGRSCLHPSTSTFQAQPDFTKQS